MLGKKQEGKVWCREGLRRQAGKRRNKRLAAAMFLLAGALCLAGAGFYFYGRSQEKTAREYDGVLVWESLSDSTAQEALL